MYERDARTSWGNVRLSYGDDNNDGDIDVTGNPLTTEIREENNYYPFGLKHQGYNNEIAIGTRDHKYGFGGKEEQDELGLDWIDITARNYDPALGRWMNIDPLAEKYYDYSSYNFTLNNPIYFSDPNGKEVDVTKLVKSDDKEDKWLLLNLMIDLSYVSGMTITLNTSEDGNKSTLGSTDCVNECSQGSEYVNYLLNSDDTIVVDGVHDKGGGSSGGGGTNNVFLHSGQINGIQNSLKDKGLDKRTMGVGMVFLHETLHTEFGANFFTSVNDHYEKNKYHTFDDKTAPYPTGPIVKRINEFRSALGLPERTNYSTTNGTLYFKKDGNSDVKGFIYTEKPLTEKQKNDASKKI